MSAVQFLPLVFESPPFFSAHWLGRHPRDQQPRMVECFGPSASDEYAPSRPAVLGLESVLLGNAPPMTLVWGELEGQRLVLYSQGQELLRTDPLPLSETAVLHWRAEVLLVWVDVPLQDPRTELSQVGLQHVSTGIAAVGDRNQRDRALVASGMGPITPLRV